MKVFENFKAISAIPRESGNEEGIRNYLVKWAKDNNLKGVVDKIGNVVVYCEATKGYENVAPLALQGHMDMVCVKTLDSKHDFKKDGIEIYEDGDFLRARDTSLGGDNGIAVAMIMDVFTDSNCKHGPLEAIFTVSEETGLTGAFNLDVSLIKSRKLINLDSEDEGIIFIGCAGGSDVTAKLKVTEKPLPSEFETISLEVKNLKGGHSGGEIHLQRANANKLLARILHQITKTVDVMLSDFKGGTKHNVIPFQAKTVFSFDKKYEGKVFDIIENMENNIKNEYKVQDPDITFIKETVKETKAVDEKVSKAFINSLFLTPHGVQAMSFAIKGIVETSANLAIVNFENETFSVSTSQRSNVESSRDNISEVVAQALRTSGAKVEIGNGYPSWAPNPDSELAAFCSKAYKELTGKEAEVTAIHAGLECGIINSKIDGMDSVSIGPNIWDVHSTSEHLSISSTLNVLAFLKHLLEIIK